jgi:FAD/FMN-containing dehydrogenase
VLSKWKKILKAIMLLSGFFVVSVVLLIGYVLIDLTPQQDNKQAVVTVVNDVTQLNPITVAQVAEPLTIKDIQNAISLSDGKISVGGGRFSQGGQIATENSLHFDMRKFNKVVSFSPQNKELTVQSGIRWRDIQDIIDPENLSIKIMQSYSNFTVGGSLSVNVHGRYMGEGPVIRSVKSIKLVQPDASVVNASPNENSELFYGAIGGYGGLGVIAEVTLALAENVKVTRETAYMEIAQYSAFFKENIIKNKDIVFHNADIYPPHYTHLRSVSWVKTDKPLTVTKKLIPRDNKYWWQPKAAKFAADSNFGKWLRQHVLEPIQYSSAPVQWRNYEASYDVKELEPSSRIEQTYVLREYFVPIDSFDRFSAKLATIFKKHNVNVLNVSVRHALPDNGSLLAWAKEEVFAFVVYYRQGTALEDIEEVKAWSQEVIDAAITEGGAYYLPYQLHATTEQFMMAYPRANEFFDLKERVDPNNRFSNKLWDQHYSR